MSCVSMSKPVVLVGPSIQIRQWRCLPVKGSEVPPAFVARGSVHVPFFTLLRRQILKRFAISVGWRISVGNSDVKDGCSSFIPEAIGLKHLLEALGFVFCHCRCHLCEW